MLRISGKFLEQKKIYLMANPLLMILFLKQIYWYRSAERQAVSVHFLKQISRLLRLRMLFSRTKVLTFNHLYIPISFWRMNLYYHQDIESTQKEEYTASLLNFAPPRPTDINLKLKQPLQQVLKHWSKLELTESFLYDPFNPYFHPP